MTRKQTICAALVAFLFVSACHLWAQDTDSSVEPLGHLGGEATVGTVDGDYVYLSQGKGISVLDNTSESFAQLGYLALPEQSLALLKSGTLLFALLDNSQGFYVIDVSDPSSPQILGSCEIEAQWSAGMAMHGLYVYVAAGRGGFPIIDVSNPSAPVVASKVNLFYPSDIAISGNHAFALTSTASPAVLHVFDLANPLEPVFRTQVTVAKGRKLTLNGDLALIACSEYTGGENGMRLFDISTPLNPTELSYVKTVKRVYTVLAWNHTAYIAGEDSLLIADISAPANPAVVGRYDVPGHSYSRTQAIFTDGDLVYLTTLYADRPLVSVDVSNPAQPRQDRTQFFPDNIQSLKVQGDRLFVSGTSFLFVYDIADRANPRLVALYPEFAAMAALQMHNGYLSGARERELVFLDIQDAQNIHTVGQYTLPEGWVANYTLSGSHAYVLTNEDQLVTVDIADLNAMVTVSQTTLVGRSRAILASPNRLWCAYGDSRTPNRLEVFDLSDPAAPAALPPFPLDGTPTTLFLDSDTLSVGSVLSDEQYKLQAYVITDPDSPQLLAEATGSGKIWDIEIRNGAILAAVEGGSVIRFVLDAMLKTLSQVAVCPSPGSLQITTTPPDDSGESVLYTSEGVTYEMFGSALQKTAAGGFSGEGKYGLAIQKFKTKKKPEQLPVLTLGKSGSAEEIRYCICDSCEYTILPFVLSVDEVDDWQVTSVGFQSSGTGDEYTDIHQIYLYHGDQRLSNTAFLRDDGFIVLSVNKTIPRGQALRLDLVYRFNPSEAWAKIAEQQRTFAIQTQVGWVTADPVNYPTGTKIPPTPISEELQVGRVWNVQTDEWFQDIQPAIDDADTRDGHELKICRSVYEETITVDKSLTLTSFYPDRSNQPTLLPGDYSQPVITALSPQVSLINLHIAGSPDADAAVAVLKTAEDFVAGDCVIHSSDHCITIDGAPGGVLWRNELSEAALDGILVRNGSLDFWIGKPDSGNTIQDNERSGIRIEGSATERTFVSGNRVERNMYGVHVLGGAAGIHLGGLDESTRNVIQKNEVGVLIEDQETRSVNLNNNSIVDNDSSGVAIASGVSEVRIGRTWDDLRNTIARNGIGIAIDGASDISVHNMMISENKKYGIQVTGESERVTIGGEGDNRANWIQDNQGPGIWLNGAHHTVSHDTLSGNTGAGIFATGREHKIEWCSVKNTESTETEEARGGGIVAQGEGMTIERCYLENNQTGGITLIGLKNSTVSDCALFANKLWGVAVMDQDSAANEIRRCEMRNHTDGVGLLVSNSSGNILSGNTSSYNQVGAGFESASNNEFSKNTVFRNTQAGIHESNGVGNRFLENDINNNAGYAIELSESTETAVNQNWIHDNEGIGLHSVQSHDVLISGNDIMHNSERGVKLSAGSRHTFRYNTIEQNKGGIEIQSSDSCLVEINAIHNNTTYHGITVLSGGRHTLKNLTINGHSGESICGVAMFDTRDNTLSNNIIKTNGVGVMLLRSHENEIVLGEIHHNDHQGIDLDRSHDNMIKQIDLQFNNGKSTGFLVANGAIRLHKSDRNTIMLNTLIDNNYSGILLKVSSDNLLSHNTLIDNHQMGIVINDSHRNRISRNKLEHNDTAGIQLYYSNDNQITNNHVAFNGVGVKEANCLDNVWHGNYIWFNLKIYSGCGYHAIASRSSFIGNTITGDKGDAIYLQQGANPILRQNNIFDNDGAGLTNIDSTLTVVADDNWWGDPAGPGANQTVQGNVSVQQWAAKPFDLVVSAGPDTIYLPAGTRDSLVVSVQNWSNFVDRVQLSVSDSLGWLTALQTFALQLADSVGAETALPITPGSSPAGSINKVMVQAQSLTTPTQSDEAVVWISLTDGAIDSIAVQPDSLHLAPGDSIRFWATAYDRYRNRIPGRFVWSTTGGEIDSLGSFRAGTTEGWFEVTAADTSGANRGSAWVNIAATTAVQPQPAQEAGVPQHFALHPNYPNPFNPQTVIRFDLPRQGRVVLSVIDVLGKEVRVLADQEFTAGSHSALWDGRDSGGREVAAGLYFYVMQAEGFRQVRKALYLK
ncbi:right-handed parallel beta-helix repeat-containing protein [candidate division KSB1 bacterium]|nr:right-handed parallel beta-helix repeat-containing protein [candidate division KSB1 bacterium]